MAAIRDRVGNLPNADNSATGDNPLDRKLNPLPVACSTTQAFLSRPGWSARPGAVRRGPRIVSGGQRRSFAQSYGGLQAVRVASL